MSLTSSFSSSDEEDDEDEDELDDESESEPDDESESPGAGIEDNALDLELSDWLPIGLEAMAAASLADKSSLPGLDVLICSAIEDRAEPGREVAPGTWSVEEGLDTAFFMAS